MKEETKKLAENLKRIRTEKGISQGDIVKSTGIDKAMISNIENEKTNPTLSTIAKLAKAVGVSIDELLR